MPQHAATIESLPMAFKFVKASLHETDKSYGRIEERTVAISAETDWLEGSHYFPDELRLPGALCMFRVMAHTYLKDHCCADTRYYISSSRLPPGLSPRRARSLGHQEQPS